MIRLDGNKRILVAALLVATIAITGDAKAERMAFDDFRGTDTTSGNEEWNTSRHVNTPVDVVEMAVEEPFVLGEMTVCTTAGMSLFDSFWQWISSSEVLRQFSTKPSGTWIIFR